MRHETGNPFFSGSSAIIQLLGFFEASSRGRQPDTQCCASFSIGPTSTGNKCTIGCLQTVNEVLEARHQLSRCKCMQHFKPINYVTHFFVLTLHNPRNRLSVLGSVSSENWQYQNKFVACLIWQSLICISLPMFHYLPPWPIVMIVLCMKRLPINERAVD